MSGILFFIFASCHPLINFVQILQACPSSLKFVFMNCFIELHRLLYTLICRLLKWYQWRSQSLPGWATRPPGGPKWGRTSVKFDEKKRKLWSKFEEKMKKVELLPTQGCEAGYGPEWHRIHILTAHNWQNWNSTFLTCHCHKISRVEAVGQKKSNNIL